MGDGSDPKGKDIDIEHFFAILSSSVHEIRPRCGPPRQGGLAMQAGIGRIMGRGSNDHIGTAHVEHLSCCTIRKSRKTLWNELKPIVDQRKKRVKGWREY